MESSLKVIVGLGNPGAEYENTRHNVGFWFIDYLAEIFGFPDFSRSGSCLTAQGSWEGLDFLLVKPLLYMNRSGWAVSGLWRSQPFPLENMLVCYDDAALLVGKIRIRESGSAGGHKGMDSILEALGSDLCHRLRFGVGRENLPDDLTDFVLSTFEPEEEEAVLDRFPDALTAVKVLFTEGIDEAMNRFNR